MPEIEIIRRYAWPPADAERFAAALDALLQATLPGERAMNGWCDSRSEPGLRMNCASAADIALHAADAADIWIYVSNTGADATDARLSIARHAADGPVELKLGIPAAWKARAQAEIANFEAGAAVAALAAPRARPAMPEDFVTLERRYDEVPADLGALLAAADTAATRLIGDHLLDASVRARGHDAPRIAYRDLARLRTELPADLQDMNLTLRPRDGYQPQLTLRVNPDWLEPLQFSCEVTPADLAKARAAIDDIERGLALRPVPDGSVGPTLQPVRARGFVEPPIDAEFVTKLAALLSRHRERQTRINGWIRTAGVDAQTNYATIDSWASALSAGIDKTLSASLALDGRRDRIAITLEPRLDFVALETAASDPAKARARFTEIGAAIGFEAAEGVLYDMPDRAKAFRLKTFARDAYRDAVRALIRQFLGVKFMVRRRDTWVAEENDRKQIESTRFDELEPFLDRIASGREFLSAQIVASGPANRLIALELDRRKNRLEIKANLDAVRFEDMVSSVQAHLTALEPWSEPAAEKPAAAKTLGQQLWNLEGAAGKLLALALAGIAFVVGYAFDRLITRDSMVMFNPPPAIVAGCVPVEWAVTTRRLFDDGAQLTREPGVLQIDAASGARIATLPAFRSGDQLYLPAGEWRLHVFDPERSRRTEIVTVKAAAPAIAGPTTPTPCVDGKPRG